MLHQVRSCIFYPRANWPRSSCTSLFVPTILQCRAAIPSLPSHRSTDRWDLYAGKIFTYSHNPLEIRQKYSIILAYTNHGVRSLHFKDRRSNCFLKSFLRITGAFSLVGEQSIASQQHYEALSPGGIMLHSASNVSDVTEISKPPNLLSPIPLSSPDAAAPRERVLKTPSIFGWFEDINAWTSNWLPAFWANLCVLSVPVRS